MIARRGVPDPFGGLFDDPEGDVRIVLQRSAARLPEVGDLVPVVHQRARRIRQRRIAVRSGLAAALVAVVALGAGVLVPKLTDDRNGGVVVPAETTASTAPSAGGQSASPAGPASPSGPMSPSGGVPGSAGAPSTPSAGWGTPSFADDFTGTALDRSRWDTVYDGQGGLTLGRWSPSEVAVGDGALHLSVHRPAGASPPTTSGGIGSRSAARRYGRWEFRWRMTRGLGVIGQFVLSPDPAAGGSVDPVYAVTLAPYSDAVLVTGSDRRLPVQATSYHTVVVEWTPQRLRTLVDGALVAESTSVPATALWPALQVFMPGPDCGGAELPADCGGTTTAFPQVMDVDWYRFTPYQG